MTTDLDGKHSKTINKVGHYEKEDQWVRSEQDDSQKDLKKVSDIDEAMEFSIDQPKQKNDFSSLRESP